MKKEKTKGKKSESNATRTNEKEERELKEKVGTYQKNAKLISISTNIQKRTQKPASARERKWENWTKNAWINLHPGTHILYKYVNGWQQSHIDE